MRSISGSGLWVSTRLRCCPITGPARSTINIKDSVDVLNNTIMMLERLLQALEQPPQLILHNEALDMRTEITALAYDSRAIGAGGLFLAIAGTHTDGRRFLKDARQRGAVAALGEAFPQDELASSVPTDLPLPYIVVPDARRALANLSCAFY